MNFLYSVAYLIHAIEADIHNSQVVEFAVTAPTSFYKAFLKMCILKCVICKYRSWIGSFHFEDWAHDQRLMAVFLPSQSFPCEGYKPIFSSSVWWVLQPSFTKKASGSLHKICLGQVFVGIHQGRGFSAHSPQQRCWLVCPALLSQAEPFGRGWWGVTEETVLDL